MSDGLIQVANLDATEYIRFYGIVRYSHCSGLELHIDQLFKNQTFEHIVIDLTHADILDSTALGLMAKIAIELRKLKREQAVIIVGDGELKNILKRVCFDQVFLILGQQEAVENNNKNTNQANKQKYRALSQLPLGEEKLLETVIKAHKNLSQLSHKNENLFRDITDGF